MSKKLERKHLVELALEWLNTAKDVTDNYESYHEQAQFSMFDQIPISSHDCEAVGGFIRELGKRHQDFELLGIGQSLISQAQQLGIESGRYDDIDPETLQRFLQAAERI